MKKILLFIAILFLSGCGMTQEEMLQAQEDCAELGVGWTMDANGTDLLYFFLPGEQNSIGCNPYDRLEN